MSAILSADDLNDFISPGVACIKPVETLPKQNPQQNNLYEVTTEEKLEVQTAAPAEISLTDCLACSGCVTSAEAVLVSLQSHAEILSTLDTKGKIFVASVSPQVRASLAATYSVSDFEAGCMIDHLLRGPHGLGSGGRYGNDFRWVVDTNVMREASLVLGAEEVAESLSAVNSEDASIDNDPLFRSVLPKRPIISSACPGWICYAEKTVPHALPHLSRLKSPQALTGTLLKTIISQRLQIEPDQIWHVAIMPCFDKKLEASREELTDINWRSPNIDSSHPPVRDVDCVITARELLMLADSRGISFPNLPRTKLSSHNPFPDAKLDAFLYPERRQKRRRQHSKLGGPGQEIGTSGGYLHHILQTQMMLHPSSTLSISRGRNPDVIEYSVNIPASKTPIFKAARYYGFRNIQNLVRKLKPPQKSKLPGVRGGPRNPSGGGGLDFAYVEVMACPGGCTNGGGQVKVDDLPTIKDGMSQKEWLGKVDEAYFSMSDDGDGEYEAINGNSESNGHSPTMEENTDVINGISISHVKSVLNHWASSTGIELERLIFTSYRKVESNVGKVGGVENERVVELAGKVGGGW